MSGRVRLRSRSPARMSLRLKQLSFEAAKRAAFTAHALKVTFEAAFTSIQLGVSSFEVALLG